MYAIRSYYVDANAGGLMRSIRTVISAGVIAVITATMAWAQADSKPITAGARNNFV